MSDAAHVHGGPYLRCALICERVLEEKDNVLSAVRIFERFIVAATGPDAPESIPKTTVPFALLISFIPGEARGSARVQVQMEEPSNLKREPLEFTVHFDAPSNPVNLILNFQLDIEQPGLYWFDVLLDGRLITRVPLLLQYQATRLPSQGHV